MKSRLATIHLLPLALVSLLGPISVKAQTWTGAVNNAWGTTGNWSSAPAFNGTDQLVMSNLVRPSQTLGATRAINKLTFTKGGFTIAGNALTLNGADAGLYSTGNNTISSDVYSLVATKFSSTSGKLTLSGVVTTNTGVAFPTLEGTGDFDITGSVQGGGGITMNGSGTVTLSGTNFYMGLTTIKKGTLKVGAAAAFTADNVVVVEAEGTFGLNGVNTTISGLAGAGSVLLGANTLTLQGSGFGSPNFSGSISGSGGLVINLGGLARLWLTGTSDYTGGTTVKGGFLSFNSDANLGGSSSVLKLDGGGIRFEDSSSIIRPILLGPGGGRLSTAPRTISNLPASISGTGPLTYGRNTSGEGTWIAQGSYNYVGKTTVYLGGLAVTANSQLGAAGNPVEVSEGTLFLRNNVNISGRTLTIAGYGNSVTGTLGALVSETGTNTWSGPITVGFLGRAGTAAGSKFTISGPLNGGNNLEINSDGDTVISGAITGTPLTKSGLGTLTLAGNNSAGGRIIVSQGVLVLQGGQAVADNAGILLDSSTTLRLDADETVGDVSDFGIPGAVVDLGSNALTFTSGASYSGSIQGTGRLTMNGAGTLELTGSNTFSGGLYVNSGILALSNDAGLGAANNPIVLTGGMLRIAAASLPSTTRAFTFASPNVSLDISSGTFTLNQSLTNAGSLTKIGAGGLILASANSYGGGTVLKEGALIVSSDAMLGATGAGLTFEGGVLRITGTTFRSTTRPLVFTGYYSSLDVADPANTFTISKSSGPSGILRKVGLGSLVLAGPTELTQADVSQGTLRLAASNVMSSSVAISVSPEALFEMQGFDQTAASLTVSGRINTGKGTLSVSNQVAGGGTDGVIDGKLALIGSNVSIFVYQTYSSPGQLKVAGSISGNGLLTKEGSGSLLLSGANPFSGKVNVSSGKLILSGSLTKTTGVNIVNGATLEVADGVLGVFGSLVNSGWLSLKGSASLSASGTITNNGVLDLSQWNGVLPANFVNGPAGIVLYSGDVKVNQVSLGSNGIQFEVNARKGLTYQLQWTQSLVTATWQNLYDQTYSPTADGLLVLRDSRAASQSEGFYRVLITASTGSHK